MEGRYLPQVVWQLINATFLRHSDGLEISVTETTFLFAFLIFVYCIKTYINDNITSLLLLVVKEQEIR